jgi:type II secretory pathway component PulM
MPALPLGDAGPYVAAAYLVFLALILVYVGIMASKLVRIERQAAELNELAARRDAAPARPADAARPAGAARPAEATRPPHPSRPAEPAERP